MILPPNNFFYLIETKYKELPILLNVIIFGKSSEVNKFKFK